MGGVAVIGLGSRKGTGAGEMGVGECGDWRERGGEVTGRVDL